MKNLIDDYRRNFLSSNQCTSKTLVSLEDDRKPYIHKGKQLRITMYRKNKNAKTFVFEPSSLVVEFMYGRQYVYGRNVEADCAAYLRFDRIQAVEILEHPVSEFPQKKQSEKSWCVGLPRNEEKKAILVEVDFMYEDKTYLREVLEREKQWGEIEEINDNQCIYRIYVNDPTEMKPWLRRFGRNARVRKSSRHRLFEEMKIEWEKMEKKYGDVLKKHEL